MQFHIRRWVMWWFAIGIACGVIAVSVILGDNLTPPQEKIVLLIGAAHWLLGGIVCWASAGVKIETGPAGPTQKPVVSTPERYWHPASDFLLPGRRTSLLPWRH